MKRLLILFITALLLVSSTISIHPISADEFSNEESEITDEELNIPEEESGEEELPEEEEIIEEKPDEPQTAPESENTEVYYGYKAADVDVGLFVSNEEGIETDNIYLPSHYELKTYNLDTPVKNQYSFGTCWAFSAIGSAETTYLKKTGQTLDLSELHLAYFMSDSYSFDDPLNLVSNDGYELKRSETVTVDNKTVYYLNYNNVLDGLNQGGNIYMSTILLSGGVGLVNESDLRYLAFNSIANLVNTGQYDDFCYTSRYRLKEANWFNLSSLGQQKMKELIYKNGGVVMGICADEDFIDDNFYADQEIHWHSIYCDEIREINHEVVVVGWDDSFSRNRFKETPSGNLPSGDGAWIVKNSWGSENGKEGYYYVSYYDTSWNHYNNMAAQLYIEECLDEEYIYQYDGSPESFQVTYETSSMDEGAIYTTKRNEILNKVGFYTGAADTDVTVSVYGNVRQTPTNGELITSQSIHCTYAGFHTIELLDSPYFTEGTRYSIVIHYAKEEGNIASILDFSYEETDNTYITRLHSSTDAGSTFIRLPSGNWMDYNNYSSTYNYTARIKGYTMPVADSSFTNGTLTISFEDGRLDVLRAATAVQIGTKTVPSRLFTKDIYNKCIRIDKDTLLEYDLWNGTYSITVIAEGYEPMTAGKAKIRLTDNIVPDYRIIKTDSYLSIYSDDSAWITAMGRKKESEGNVIFKFNDLRIELTPDDYTAYPDGDEHDPNGEYDPCIRISMNTLKQKLPGVNGRRYQMDLDAYGYPVAISTYTSANHFSKADDILYVTLRAGEGLYEDGTNEKLFKVTRGSAFEPEELPLKTYCTVSSYTDSEGHNAAVNNVQNDLDIIAQYLYSRKVGDVTGSLDESVVLSDEEELILSTQTPKATIEYRYESMSEFVTYTGAISLDIENAIYEDGYYHVRIYAYGRKNNYENSDVVILDYRVYDASVYGWGDINEDDRTSFIDASQVSSGLWVAGIEDQTFDPIGNSHKNLSLTVYYHKTKLTEGKDYGLTYKNNTKAGEASITVSAKGNYSGSLVKNYTIEPYELSEDNGIVLEASYSMIRYTGKVLKPTLKVKLGNKLLSSKTDYTLVYTDGDDYKAAGGHRITITGKGNYTGSMTYTYIITEKTPVTSLKYTITSPSYDYKNHRAVYPFVTVKDGSRILYENIDYSISHFAQSIDAGTYSLLVTGKGNYTGTKVLTYVVKGTSLSKWKVLNLASTYRYEPNEAIVPSIRVCSDNKCTLELRENIDYTVDYSNNTAIGTATLVIRGIGGYTGEIKKTFKIAGSDISKYRIVMQENSFDYIGEEICPDISVQLLDDHNEVLDELSYEDGDYEIAYENNLNAGKASITVKGKNGFTGSLKASFTINAVSLNDTGRIEASQDFDCLPYVKSKTENSYTIADLETEQYLEINKDYKVTYKNNTKLGTATATIKGTGNYKGTLNYTFTVVKQDIAYLEMDVKDLVATKKKGISSLNVKLVDTNEKTLVNKTDYTLTIVYMYETVLANGTIRQADTPVGGNDVVPAGTILKVTASGKGNYTGSITKNFYIGANDFSKANVSINDQLYTGKKIILNKNQITVKHGDYVLTQDDYEIVSYKNNIAVGTATIELKGKGDYIGNKTVKFKIVARPFVATIVYNGNASSSGKMTNQLVIGDTVTLKKNSYLRKGYSFVGWNTLANGNGIPYEDEDMVNLKDNETLVLYAKWRMDSYSISYELDGGNNSEDNPSSYRVITSTIHLKNAEKVGYNFRGWYSDAKFKNKVTAIAYGSTGNRTLYAKFTPVTYSVIFDGNGAKGKMSKLTGKHYEDSYVLPECRFVKEGYVFAFWKCELDGVSYYFENADEVSSLPVKDTSSVVLKAIWAPISYTVHYNVNGGVINEEIEDVYVSYDTSFVLSNGEGFAHANSVFALSSWNTKADGTGRKYSLGSITKNLTYLNNTTVNLYAMWNIPTPYGLEAEPLYHAVGLSWVEVLGAQYYRIYRRDEKGTYSCIGQTTYTSVLDTSVDYTKSAKIYYYKVTACYGESESAYSVECNARTSYKLKLSGSYLKQEDLRKLQSTIATLTIENNGPLPLILETGLNDWKMIYNYHTSGSNSLSDCRLFTIKQDGVLNVFDYLENEEPDPYTVSPRGTALVKLDLDPYNRGDLHSISVLAAAQFECSYDGIEYTVAILADTRKDPMFVILSERGNTKPAVYEGHTIEALD